MEIKTQKPLNSIPNFTARSIYLHSWV